MALAFRATSASVRIYQLRRSGCARTDDLHYLALDQSLGQGRILNLLTDSYGQSRLETTTQVGIDGVVGYSSQGHRMIALGVSAGQGNAGDPGQGLRVFKKSFVEIAHPKEQQGVGMLAFDLQVLGQHGCELGPLLAVLKLAGRAFSHDRFSRYTEFGH